MPRSNKKITPETEPINQSPKSRRHGLRKVAFVTAGGLAVIQGIQHETAQMRRVDALEQKTSSQDDLVTAQSRQIDRQTAIIASQNNIDADVITGKSLHDIKSLMAYDVRVSPEQRERMQRATVEVGKRLKGSASPWELSCTATKVTNGKEEFVLSATHCFTGDLPPVSGKGGGGGVVGVSNITNTSLFEYAILDNELDHAERPTAQPLARVTALSVDMYASDIALLRIDESTATDDFISRPAVSFGDFSSAITSATPGEQAALYSMPQASDFVPVSATGTYLGRVYTSADLMSSYSSQLDLVAIWPDSASEDACNYGASGSSAVFAGGFVSGPLSFRNNTNGFDANRDVQAGDVGGMSARLHIESQLGLDLSGVPTICGYTVPDERSFDMLQASLDVPGFYEDPSASMK